MCRNDAKIGFRFYVPSSVRKAREVACSVLLFAPLSPIPRQIEVYEKYEEDVPRTVCCSRMRVLGLCIYIKWRVQQRHKVEEHLRSFPHRTHT